MNNLINTQEKEDLSLLNDEMYCNKYKTLCLDVPDETIEYIGIFGYSNYSCDLDCTSCSEIEGI